MSKKSNKDFKSYAMIFVIGIILTTITILGILQAPIRKLSMEGEVKAYEVEVKHRSKRLNRKDKKWKTTNILL